MFLYISPESQLHPCSYFTSDYNSMYSNWRAVLLSTQSPPCYISSPLLFLCSFSLVLFPSALLTSCCHYQFPPVFVFGFEYVACTSYPGDCVHTGVFFAALIECLYCWDLHLPHISAIYCLFQPFPALLFPLPSPSPSFQFSVFITSCLFFSFSFFLIFSLSPRLIGSLHCAVSWFVLAAFLFLSHFSPIVVSVYFCPFYSPSQFLSMFFVFLFASYLFCDTDLFFAGIPSFSLSVFVKLPPPFSLDCTSPFVSPSLFVPLPSSVWTSSYLSIPTPPFLHHAHPSLTCLCLNRIPPFSSSSLSTPGPSSPLCTKYLPFSFASTVFVILSLPLYLVPVSHFLSHFSFLFSCLILCSLCFLCIFMVHVLIFYFIGISLNLLFCRIHLFLCSLGGHICISVSVHLNLQYMSTFSLWPGLLYISKHWPPYDLALLVAVCNTTLLNLEQFSGVPTCAAH